MRVPISWLREFVALPPDALAIADRLAMLGFPVEGIEQRPKITGVVTGRIAELQKHPNADRLQVAQVDVGTNALTIVTAATNVAPGQSIAVATVGAQLPELRIERRTMRGIVSDGMMISADELALPPEWFEDGILQLDAAAPLGVDAVELFGLTGEVLDVEITANRPDAMSIVGLARELAASYDVALQLPPLANPAVATASTAAPAEVSLESADCRRFVAQRFENLKVEAAPLWMRIRLALAGQRPINNVVDISNYVMLETGQPLHFYDVAKIDGGKLVVRDAREGETIVTLDGAARTLSPQALVIADARKPLCLAGLMGAQIAEVGPDTTAIVLEAANFNGARVRRMSAALALRTEASSRHEKSLAPALTDIGAARAAHLLVDLGATASAASVFGASLEAPEAIPLRVEDVERLLGLAIPAARLARHLTALGCSVESKNGVLSVTPPQWRRDLTLPVDLIEEVARIEGYDRIEPVVPSVPPHEISSAAFEAERAAAHVLDALGYDEVITYSLRGEEDAELMRRAGALPVTPVEVRNPLSEEQRFLRSSLLPGLLRYLSSNSQTRVFEIGDVFATRDGDVAESSALAFGFTTEPASQPWRDDAFLRLKGDCEVLLRRLTGRMPESSRGAEFAFHPGKTARLSIDGRDVGCVGCIDPRVSAAFGVERRVYLCVLKLAELPSYETPHYRAPSKFPSTYRDIALVLDSDVEAAAIERRIGAALGELCASVHVFDEYRGPQVPGGRKSVAVRITLQRFDATLTDEQADAAVKAVLEAMREQFGATIRE